MKQFGILRVGLVDCSVILFQQFFLHFNRVQQFFLTLVFYVAVCKNDSEKKSREHNYSDYGQCV